MTVFLHLLAPPLRLLVPPQSSSSYLPVSPTRTAMTTRSGALSFTHLSSSDGEGSGHQQLRWVGVGGRQAGSQIT